MSLSRISDGDLTRWLDGPRRKPLVIRGARQVGKSTLVRRFAAQRGLPLVEINLEQRRALEPVFATLDVKRITLELEAVGHGQLRPGTLLFLDEIQATPSALAALRYLHEGLPHLPLVAAGSLLEMVLKSHEFSMPVGRIEYLHLGPLTFTEFLRAVGDEDLVEWCARWRPGEPWPRSAHDRLATRQREFLLVGGMPEAVAAYAGGEGVESVRRVQRSIIGTYRDDFAKYGATPTALIRLQTVFDAVPGMLGEKVKYANVSRDEKAREMRAAFDLLALARVIWRVIRSDASGLPLEAKLDRHTYKCLFLDVGLASLTVGIDWTALGKFDDRRLINEGGLAEQFVGQHLLFRKRGLEDPSLCYWLREGKNTNAEVDYVIDHGRTIVPVEVKAGTAGGLRSLHQFFARELPGSARIALRFDLNPPTLSPHEHRLANGRAVSYQLLSLPLFMVDESSRLLGTVLAE